MLTNTNHDSATELLKVLDLFLDALAFRQEHGLLLVNNSFPLCEIGKLIQQSSFVILGFL